MDRRLVRLLKDHFALKWNGIHGAPHWARVRENGLRLAKRTGANLQVVELFAFLHDSCRIEDGADPMHGSRAAEFARSLRGDIIQLDDAAFDLLVLACSHHSDGFTRGDPTVVTCWDADRLDLGRIGIRPDPRRLCTRAARKPEMIEWADRRSRKSG